MRASRHRRRRARLGRLVACAALCLGSVAARVGPRDRDGDGIFDDKDPFPDDADRPGRATPNRLYANTSARLFEVHPSEGGAVELRDIGPFFFSDGVRRSVTDIAVDPWGVMWASSFDAIMVCNPRSARCEVVARTTASLNALEHARIPPHGEATDEVALYAASTDGGLHLVHRDGKVVRIGTLEGPSSGDLTPLDHFLGAVRDDPVTGRDHLVAIEPGAMQTRDAGELPGDSIYGLARCDDRTLYAFDESGAIFTAQATQPRSWRTRVERGHPWWGASCAPAAFALPDEGGAAQGTGGEADPRAGGGEGDDRGAAPRGCSWCGVR